MSCLKFATGRNGIKWCWELMMNDPVTVVVEDVSSLI